MARLELFDRETDRQLNAHAQTVTTLGTRTSLIVTTAVVFVSLIYDWSMASCSDLLSLCGLRVFLHYVALVAAPAAAVVGVLALLMNRAGEEVDLEAMEGELVGRSDAVVLRSLTQAKRQTLEQDRLTVEKHERKYRWSLLLLIAALSATVAGTIVEDWM